MLARITALIGIIFCLGIAYHYSAMSDIEKLNKVLFNRLAPEYEETYKDTIGFLTTQIRKESRDFIDFKRGGRLLDYACGTGLLSDALADQVSQAIGIDVSSSMVAAYNSKAVQRGFVAERRNAYLGNLLTAGETRPAAFSGPKFFHFDLVGVALGFHHFADPLLAASRLVERLSFGGVLFIIDLLPHTPERPMDGVTHNGFSEEEMRILFERAGAGRDFRFKVLEEEIVLKHGQGHGHGHGNGEGPSHGHGHGHGHGQGHGHSHGHHGRQGHGGATTYKVFFARGVKA